MSVIDKNLDVVTYNNSKILKVVIVDLRLPVRRIFPSGVRTRPEIN